ncbi:hypothetical protein NPIL_355481 [Nephila pilipes]|uniref:Uncharacterized protein n=1 Tax=Nephila pilipes TaxID=299642 RepID=A0A8X6QMK3_NEPPI|nr:hypothetical protein NPIL_355481 [Nephila pilipes]
MVDIRNSSMDTSLPITESGVVINDFDSPYGSVKRLKYCNLAETGKRCYISCINRRSFKSSRKDYFGLTFIDNDGNRTGKCWEFLYHSAPLLYSHPRVRMAAEPKHRCSTVGLVHLLAG